MCYILKTRQYIDKINKHNYLITKHIVCFLLSISFVGLIIKEN